MGTLWVLAFGLAPLLTAVVGLAAWRHRRENPGARALALTLAGISGWSLACAWLLAPLPPTLRAVAYPAVFLSVGATVAGFWGLSRLLADPRWRMSRRTGLLLAVEPVALAVLSVLPGTADLVFGRTDLTAPTGAVMLVGGPLFAVHSLYSYAFIAGSLLRLLRVARAGAPLARRQAVVLLVSAVPPTIGNLVMTTSMRGDGVVDLTPLFFIATGLIAGWAVLRAGLLEVVPVARDLVVETMTDGVLVSDRAGRLVDLNPAARRLLQLVRPDAGPDPVGERFADLVGPGLLAAVLPDGPAADGTFAAGHAVVQVSDEVWLDVQTVPVGGRGHRGGRLTVVRDVSTEQRREADLRRLNAELAEHVATVERLRAALAEEAVRDPLTGLHNRRHLDRELDAAVAPGAGVGPVAVVAVDVDHFKSVNDRWGHAAGDDVLRSVADELRAAARAEDVVARVGGEEFVLVLAGADAGAAATRAEELRARCAALVHAVPGGSTRLTVSIGVAVAGPDGDGGTAVLARADTALYAAKAAGRDRVVLAAPGATRADVTDVFSPS